MCHNGIIRNLHKENQYGSMAAQNNWMSEGVLIHMWVYDLFIIFYAHSGETVLGLG